VRAWNSIYMYMGMGLNVLIEIKDSVFIHLCECCVFFTLIDNPCTFELKLHENGFRTQIARNLPFPLLVHDASCLPQL